MVFLLNKGHLYVLIDLDSWPGNARFVCSGATNASGNHIHPCMTVELRLGIKVSLCYAWGAVNPSDISPTKRLSWLVYLELIRTMNAEVTN